MASSLPKAVPRTPSALTAIRIANTALRESKKVDPRDRYVVLYPNYDASHLGMAFKLLGNREAELVFQQVSEMSQRNILKMCIDKDNQELLSSVENKSIAAFTTSHATMAKLAADKPEMVKYTKAAGGIGTGYLNSLVFCGSMTFENAFDLMRRGAQAMDKASAIIPSGRVEIRIRPATSKRLVMQAAKEHCQRLGIPEEVGNCSIAKQVVPHVWEVAGHIEAIKFLETDGLRLFQFKSILRSKRDDALHTPLMEPVSQFLSAYISDKMKYYPDYLKEPETCSAYSATTGWRTRSIKCVKKDLINFPTRPLLVQQLFDCLYKRPRSLAMPNTLILWDSKLRKNLGYVNRLAAVSSKMIT